MDILVTYDVNTLSKEGRKRLRKVAQQCKNFGQRVQLSVFECTVDEVNYELLKKSLLDTIDSNEDSLRIYKFRGGRNKTVEAYGKDRYVDFNSPLVV